MLWGLILCGGIFAATYYITRLKKYPIQVMIWEKIGDSYRLSKGDRAKLVNEGGIQRIVGLSKKNKISLGGISYDKMHSTHKGGYILELMKVSLGDYKILPRSHFDADLNKFAFRQPEYDTIWWSALAKREVSDRYTIKSAWEKYGAAITIAGSLAFVLILVILSWDYYNENLQITADALVNAANKISAGGSGFAAPPPPQIQGNPNVAKPPDPLPFEQVLTGR